jgi:hypothetical protein
MSQRNWEYIGGHQWSLIDKTEPYGDSITTIEIEKGKYPIVGFLNGNLNKDELQRLLEILKEEYE